MSPPRGLGEKGSVPFRYADGDGHVVRPALARDRSRAGASEAPLPPARFLILRLLGIVYLTGFAIFINQGLPLLGSHGLPPIAEFTSRVGERLGGVSEGFARLPSVFWFAHSTALLIGSAWAGALLALAVALGVTNAVVMGVLWALYMSFVHVGQDWYATAGRSSCSGDRIPRDLPLPARLDPARFRGRRPPPVVIWLFRWLIFRIMIGAGLIKLRGDSCWRDLTCLQFHYETQPNPNPFSRVLHFAPHALNEVGVLFNHLTELVMPWLSRGRGCGRRDRRRILRRVSDHRSSSAATSLSSTG